MKHATEAKLLFLRIYNPEGSVTKKKKVAERALYKAGGWGVRQSLAKTLDGHHAALHSRIRSRELCCRVTPDKLSHKKKICPQLWRVSAEPAP